MVLKLGITLNNTVNQNCHLLALSDRPPNEVPTRDPFSILWVCHYRFLLRSGKSIVAWLNPIPIFGNKLCQLFVFMPTFLVVVWFLLTSYLFPNCTNIVLVCGDCWTYPLLARIACGVELTISQMCSFFSSRWCVAIIFPTVLSSNTPAVWKVVSSSWNMGGNFLAKYRCIFGGCGNNWLWPRPKTLPIL